jgi:deoxycytidylate deaminase/dephospho-CoA kinase
MAIHPRAKVIGLTAPFGSGSTTSAGILSDRLAFRSVRLSSFIRQDFERQNPKVKVSRSDLQSHGDQMRKQGNLGILAELAVKELETDKEQLERVVVDGIRNVAEIDFLRDTFGNRFYLFALECPLSNRWDRLRPSYERINRTMTDFLLDDRRDRDEELEYGQQVQSCVDQADVLIDNSDDVSQADLRTKLGDYAELILGLQYRFAKPMEIYMNVAYSASHGSKCIKRQVGAVLVSALPNVMGEVVGQGFNENPLRTKPCIEEPRYGADLQRRIPGKCYRDIVRQEAFVQLSASGARCPKCGKPIKLSVSVGPPWQCANCKDDLEEFFWPERAMTLCTAVHAEVAAILSAAGRTRDTTLYSTTFPCFQCSEKITQAGITNIVFNEIYPDIRAAERLEIAGINVLRFEGVRSRRFDEIFSKAQKSAEQKN